MNLSLAFFHGEQALVGLVFAAGLVLFVIPLVIYVWLWLTNVSERKLSFAYLILTVITCALTAFSSPGTASVLNFAAVYTGFVLTLPWNIITLVVLYLGGNPNVSDYEFALIMLLGAGINTMLVYLFAKKIRGRVK